ncbi:hypothetical protein [Streptomyces sp. ODS28]|uniref:hypothetical protein n=1 Tax=Streptomyces sp. ODS28 TaxID=3136688 RepID=UPI0031E8B898
MRTVWGVGAGDTLARGLAVPLCAVCAALLAAVLGPYVDEAAGAGGAAGHAWALAAFALPAAWGAAVGGPLRAPAASLVCWLFYDGFVLNSASELGWSHADRTALCALLAAGAAGATGALAVRALRAVRRARAARAARWVPVRPRRPRTPRTPVPARVAAASTAPVRTAVARNPVVRSGAADRKAPPLH